MTQEGRDALREQLEIHEGRVSVPYQDSRGHWTVGVGHLMSRPLPEPVIDLLRDADMNTAILDCCRFSWFPELDEVRQRAVVDWMFNLGYSKASEFRHFIAAMARKNYEAAAMHLLNSLWAKQVGNRAVTLSEMIRTGHD